MLVEFSPWETTDTSLRLSLSSKRKRPRVGLSTSSSLDNDFSIAGSFITTKAGRRKNRDSRNVLAITSSHRVSVLVSNSKGFAAGAPKTEALDSSYSLRENSRMQYSCRPGKATAFLPSSQENANDSPGKKKKNDNATSKIPAVLDAKNDRLWALQNGNKRLVIWDAQSEGPDPKGKGSCDLKETALSMDLLPSGVIIGTLESGSIFYAFVSDTNSVKCHYIPQTNSLQEKKLRHAGSFVCIPETSSPPSSGTKRKAPKKSSEPVDVVYLYQIFVDDSAATVIRNELPATAVDGDNKQIMTSGKRKVASVSLVPPGSDEQSSSFLIEDANLIKSTMTNPETATLYFRVHSTHSDNGSSNNHYCCSIQLQTATLSHPPFPVPCRPQHIAMVTPKLLAIGAKKQIQLCDALTGVPVHTEALPPGLLDHDDDDDDWKMLADTRKGLLVVLYCQGEQLKATKTLLQQEDDLDAPSSPSLSQMSLAARLSASLGASAQKPIVWTKSSKLLSFDQKESGAAVHVEQGVEEGLKIMQDLESMILRRKRDGYKAGRLVDTYNGAVKKVLQQPTTCGVSPNGKGTAKNDAQAGASERINGIHDDGKNGMHRSGVKGKDNGSLSPADVGSRKVSLSDASSDLHSVTTDKCQLPLSFVDATTTIVLGLLDEATASSSKFPKSSVTINEDCCSVLGSLIQTGKVSARKHFDDSGDMRRGHYFAKLLSKMGCKRTQKGRLYSPVDAMLDMLSHCADISEAQMVTMLHFMLCRSRPDDIARAFCDSASLPEKHRYKKLGTRYLELAADPQTDKKDESDKLKGQLVVAGASFLLEKVLTYSHANPTLLCCALRDTLSVGQESRLLLRLLNDVALSQSALLESKVDLLGSSIQWIQALFDAVADKTSLAQDLDLEHLRDTLERATQQTELLIDLEPPLDQALQSISSEKARAKKKRRKIISSASDEQSAPPYSVERLTL